MLLVVTLLAGITAAAGCGKFLPEQGQIDIIATVDGEIITMGELDRKISAMPAYYQDIAMQRKREFLDDMVDEILLYNESLKRRLDRDEEIVGMMKDAKRRILVASLIKDEVEGITDVPEEEIENYYNDNVDKFNLPERWRASHILVNTEEEANAILVELANGASFEDLAKERSEDASAVHRNHRCGYWDPLADNHPEHPSPRQHQIPTRHLQIDPERPLVAS